MKMFSSDKHSSLLQKSVKWHTKILQHKTRLLKLFGQDGQSLKLTNSSKN